MSDLRNKNAPGSPGWKAEEVQRLEVEAAKIEAKRQENNDWFAKEAKKVDNQRKAVAERRYKNLTVSWEDRGKLVEFGPMTEAMDLEMLKRALRNVPAVTIKTLAGRSGGPASVGPGAKTLIYGKWRAKENGFRSALFRCHEMIRKMGKVPSFRIPEAGPSWDEDTGEGV